ncbi:hypothetical protein [Cellulomonas sp. NS3]|uniref:hypothetical protein n=1 Tax=Cellulomonas sp. NS3 TaxID=2973977 RepID=UPI00216147D8|nr:hypothetical protein [Cellulomonas sp. NS3]
MIRPAPVDRGAYLRARWRARAATTVWGCVAAYGAAAILAAAGSDSGLERATAGWVFFQLGLVLVPLGWAVVRAWRRSAALRPLRLHTDAGPGAWAGVPELDEPATAPHTGLTGLAEPPRRW